MEMHFGRASVVLRIESDGQDGRARPAAQSPARDAASPAPAADGREKYTVVAPIGSGGMGDVLLVQDNDLRREVAMKVLRRSFAGDDTMRRKFVAEAQATSQLEHPGIPPVHDIGATPDGDVYFTMKIVRGRTLTQVLRELVLGVKETRQVYTLHKLITVMEHVSEAVHFAHEKGLIHRDLKPENLMLGEFGEVHVVDWGIAKVATTEREDAADPDETIRTVDTDQALITQAGTVKGTIPYMSPEQARGEPLDRRTDVYSLGTILYEILTLRPAFEGSGADLVQRVRAGDFPPVETRTPKRPVPESLAAICRKSMSADAARRHASAREFGDDLRAWLDGRAERERRHRDAEGLAAQGRDALVRHARLREAAIVAERAAEEEALRCRPWQPREEKRALARARRDVTAARREAALAFAEATRLLEAALAAESDNLNARRALADLWRDHLVEAERHGAADDAAQALTMVRRYDDGRLAAFVSGDGCLELSSSPPGAEAFLHRLDDDDGVLAAADGQPLGCTPLVRTLPMGSYLAVLRSPDYADVRYPVHITRNCEWRGVVELRTRKEVGDEFVFVPGGPFLFGEGRDLRLVELADFAIQARPVTFRDWGEFLSDVERESGLTEARRYVPRIRGDGDQMARGPDGAWRPLPIVVEGVARERCEAELGKDFLLRTPVVGITWHDAVAYCDWRSRTTGREWRLPTEEEREKAARGVDGRRFPWGDLDDATLGKCRDSREWNAQEEPSGRFPTAVSVYGVVDAAGNTSDWTDSWFDARCASRVTRGGSWNFPSQSMRCAFRNNSDPSVRYSYVGVRCARSLPPRRVSPFARR